VSTAFIHTMEISSLTSSHRLHRPTSAHILEPCDAEQSWMFSLDAALFNDKEYCCFAALFIA